MFAAPRAPTGANDMTIDELAAAADEFERAGPAPGERQDPRKRPTKAQSPSAAAKKAKRKQASLSKKRNRR